jgi:thiopeptide-type bacteriocin biosynthesis protein
MKLSPLTQVLCRTPAFAVHTPLSAVWDELKEKIKSASPNFYHVIAHTQHTEWEQLDEKVRYTLWKYFNRSRCRATPFGAFASFSLLPLAPTASPLYLAEKLLAHHFIDWDEKEQIAKTPLAPHTTLLANASAYSIGEELRYISRNEGQFQLSSIELFPELSTVLAYCHGPQNIAAICSQLAEQHQLDSESTNVLLEQLRDAQLLLDEQHPNISGQEYFSRIGHHQAQSPETYLISERPYKTGALGEEALKHLPELLTWMSSVLPKNESAELSTFKSAFFKKYEGKEIPLSIALDPELGIGYGNLEQAGEEQELIALLQNAASQNHASPRISYGAFQQFLLREISKGQPIDLEKFRPETNKTAASKLPNSLNILLHFFENQPVIHSAGGATANALLGRFTLASAPLENFCRFVANLEQESNPEVLFFDIAYQAEKHIDNVNRRKKVYEQELPILTWSENQAPLYVEDILLSVQHNELVLRSKSHNKRLVPRVPTAYNYNRSDLSLYRFLCDVQQQHLHCQLSFQLSDFFSDLDHYPRASYKGIIVSPETWLVPEYLPTQPQALAQWLAEKGIQQTFKCGKADHVLCFDPHSEEDNWAFAQYLQQHQHEKVYIWEALIDDSTMLNDESGKAYVAEYVLSYAHHQQVYQPLHNLAPASPALLAEDQVKMPGEEWLYLEIYGHQARANALLLGPILECINAHEYAISKWFFIRYTDPSPHLRLRLCLKKPQQLGELLSAFSSQFKPQVLSGMIREVQVKTYYQEAKRYGPQRMELIESIFHRDSTYVLNLLRQATELEELHANTLSYLEQCCTEAYPDIEERVAFAQQGADAFAKQCNLEAEHFRKINLQYKALRDKIRDPLFSTTEPDLAHSSLRNQALETCESHTERHQLLGDLIHMHINRVFSDHQRIHEALLYQYLVQHLKAKRATSYAQRKYSA